MKNIVSLLAVGLLLSACSSAGVLGSLTGGGTTPTPASNNIQVGNTLAMPPDLQLRAPADAATDTYQPNVASTPEPQTALVQPKTVVPVVRPPAEDVYAQYGISKTKPDGTQKTKDQLQAELKAAMLKKKRETQPGYGTIFNMGNIFSDG